MQNAVENQHSKFARKISPVFFRVAPGRCGRNSNVPQINTDLNRLRTTTQPHWPAPCHRRERQHVGGPFFLAKRFVQPGDLRVADQTDGDACSLESHCLLRAAQKRFEGTPRQANRSLSVQNHPCCVSLSCSFPDSFAEVPALPFPAFPPRCG